VTCHESDECLRVAEQSVVKQWVATAHSEEPPQRNLSPVVQRSTETNAERI